MSELETRELRDNIVSGLGVAFQKLLQEKKKNGSDFVFADKGKLIKVKAEEMRT